MCPGLPNVCGVDSGSASAFIVSARSCALTPVVQPSSLSTVTVNGVPRRLVLSSTWWGSLSSLQRLIVIGAHRTPLPLLSMKFTFSSVMSSAAVMRSPSFSRSGSSTTITNFPSRKSSMASSTVAGLKFSVVAIMLLFDFVFLFYLMFRCIRVLCRTKIRFVSYL